LTEGPVAVLVADGTVVELAGPVVLVDGEVVDGAPLLVVVDVDEDPPDSDVPPGEEPAPAEVVEGPLKAVALGAMPRVRGADFVWNASTPASPVNVATATIGARFIGFVPLSQVSCDRPSQKANASW
jgi:hypothetical protein